MKITSITSEKVSLDLEKSFTVAIGTITRFDTVIVKVQTDVGITGYGEGTSASFVTGETPEIIQVAIAVLGEALIGINPWSIGQVHRVMDGTLIGNGAAKAAIDIALYDIMGKAAGLPLYVLLGGSRMECETDMTVGIDVPAAMANEAREIAARGFRQIKVKCGKDPGEDIEAVRLIREAVGPGVRIKVDANQGWSAGDAVTVAAKMAAYDVEAIEQPVRAWDTEGLAYVRSKAQVKIMADESCFTPQDALHLIKLGAVDVINIKLMKCGGLYRAMQISAIAASAGIPCMLGCMLESRLSIAAGAALVAADSNFHYCDLDSFLSFKGDGIISGGFDFDCPVIKLTDEPGHGAKVNM